MKMDLMPFLRIQKNAPIQLLPLNEFFVVCGGAPHRHDFLMVLWILEGVGVHIIDGSEYEMVPGRLFLIQEGQVHSVKQFAKEGWLLLFEEAFITGLQASGWQNKTIEIMSNFSIVPFVDIDDANRSVIVGLFRNLYLSLDNPKWDLKLVQHHLFSILLYANQQHPKARTDDYLSHTGLIRELKILIHSHFVKERDITFYSAALRMNEIKLNSLILNAFGKSISQLIVERLLVECKILLLYTMFSTKDIAQLLGFTYKSQLFVFFKNNTGYSPLEYREKKQFI